MGVNAKFIADFESFYAAVQKAEVSLRSFETGSAKVETSLNRMANSLSGTKLIQDATVMAQAVEQIGGTSKLTTNELASLSAKANEAVEKMKRLGIEVPPGLQAIASATSEAGHQTAGLTGMVERLTERFVIYETLRHIFDFAKDAIESTARIEDLAKATGLSTDAIQRFSYVGKAFGVDSEQMARGVEQLSAKLASGDKNAVAAVDALGLSVKDLIAAGPQEAFIQVAEAAGRVESPMRKGGLAADLFGGKLAKVLLPILRDMRQELDKPPADAIISELNIKRAHDFEVGLDRLTTRMKAWAFVAAETFVDTVTGNVPLVKQAAAAREAADAFELSAKMMKSHGDATKNSITAAVDMANTLKAWKRDALVPLTDAQIQGINVGLEYGKSTTEIAKALGVSDIAVQQYTKASQEALATYEASIESANKYKAVLDELHKVTFGLAMERQKQWRDEATKTMATVNNAVLAEFNALTQLNAEYGLTADGELKMSGASEVLRQALIKLHLQKVDGISQSKQEQVLIDQYQKSTFDAATAADGLTQSVGHGVEQYGVASTATDVLAKHTIDAANAFASFGGVVVAAANSMQIFNSSAGLSSGIENQVRAMQAQFERGGFFNTSNAFAGTISGARAGGGPVSAGGSYIVGEKGPELFLPRTSGSIVPSGSAGPTTIVLQVDGRVLAKVVTDELTRTMKTSRLFPAA